MEHEQTTNDDLNDHAVERAMREDAEANDPVNHPKHYRSHPSGVECITVVEHFNFNRGNAMKYIWRAGEKGDVIEDLRKAAWYVQREIERLTRPAVPVPDVHVAASPETIDEVLAPAGPITCLVCNLTFGTAETFQAHREMVHGEEEIPPALDCPICRALARMPGTDWICAHHKKTPAIDSTCDGVLAGAGHGGEDRRSDAALFAGGEEDDGWDPMDLERALDRARLVEVGSRRFINSVRGLRSVIVALLRAYTTVQALEHQEAAKAAERLTVQLTARTAKLEHVETEMTAAYAAAGISDMENLARHITRLRTMAASAEDYRDRATVAQAERQTAEARRGSLLALVERVGALLAYLDGRCRSDGSENETERAALNAYGYVRARLQSAMAALPQDLREEACGA